MAKMKLLGIGNVKNFNYYTFEKKQGILKFLRDVLGVLNLKFELVYEDENYKRTKRTLKDCVDRHESIDSMLRHKTRADIFYGKDKVFLMVHCPEKLREKFNAKVGKLTMMPKVKLIRKSKVFKSDSKL
jgi:regulator of extracellular matrix RemA (YlzA/DUF370 family)|tara:strand:- start:243 stop:629 length:387 start_codon:yes stop_codon:yes gene_type:complete